MQCVEDLEKDDYMGAIKFVHKGNFNHLEAFLARTLKIKPVIEHILRKYGERGVEALKAATPKDTGKTSESWKYEIVKDEKGYRIVWSNTNVVQDGKYPVNVAILLQYGHATKNGGFVKGNDYINPAINQIFQSMADEAWKEVTDHG